MAPSSIRSPPTKNIPTIDLEKRVHHAIQNSNVDSARRCASAPRSRRLMPRPSDRGRTGHIPTTSLHPARTALMALVERVINDVELPDYAGVPDSGAPARSPITSSARP
jgi:hypothetical protein